MLNDRIQSIPRLQSALVKAEDLLTKLPPETPFGDFEYELAFTFLYLSVSTSLLFRDFIGGVNIIYGYK